MRLVVLLLLATVGALMAYVRLAPVDLSKVHLSSHPQGPGDYPETGGFKVVRTLTVEPADGLAAVKEIAEATDRTRLVAGSVEEGLLTFETRSRVFGFPDYTTVSIHSADAGSEHQDAPHLMIHARLRFGIDDLGVNRRRVEGWLPGLVGIVSAP
ncbi:MAG: DUF1499 domain-containing protein [Pseudomonadota bacterium]